MRNRFSFLLALLLLLGASTSTFAQATTESLQYRIEANGNVTITGYIGTYSDIVIPSEIEGRPVKEVGNGAFMQNSTVKTVVISEGIAVIGSGAFSQCSAVESIELPSTINIIGEGAFEYCQALHTINIPEGVTSIAARTFAGVVGMESITIPSSIQTIGDYAFGNTGFTHISLPVNLEKIDHAAFASCNLVNVVVPNSVTEIGPIAFWDSRELVSIVLPAGIKEIEYGMFQEDKALEKIAIPKSVAKIPNDILRNCYKASIWGFKGSPAETYSKKNNIPFVSVDPVEDVALFLSGENVTKAKLSIDLGSDITYIQLSAQTSPETPWPDVTWRSSDAKVALVDVSGLVTGLRKGKATITATAVDGSGKKATTEITVASYVGSISIIGENTVKAGKKVALQAAVMPETADSKKLDWTTSDKSIAIVDTKGTVTAKKVGEASTVTITATAKDGSAVFANFAITVIP